MESDQTAQRKSQEVSLLVSEMGFFARLVVQGVVCKVVSLAEMGVVGRRILYCFLRYELLHGWLCRRCSHNWRRRCCLFDGSGGIAGEQVHHYAYIEKNEEGYETVFELWRH